MRYFAAVVFAVCCIAADATVPNIEIRDGSLCRWPKDFKGKAIIPPGVRYIERLAFSECKGITAVAFPETLESIGQLAFIGCSELRDVQIPHSVTNIGRSAFFNCLKLTNVVICADVKEIPGNMFSHCHGLQHVELPDGLIAIGDMAFRGCRSLQTIDIPRSVRRLDRATFIGCRRLFNVELPDGIEIVDEFAFAGCYDLRRLVLRSVPKNVGRGAFGECFNLRGCVVSDTPQSYALYSMSPECGMIDGAHFNYECLIGRYGTVDDALAVNDRLCGEKVVAGPLLGLEQVLRIAADSLADEIPDLYSVYDKLDSIAANLYKLGDCDNVDVVKNYFKSNSPMSADLGDRLVVTLSSSYDIVIMLDFQDENLIKISLSEGLKNFISRRLKYGKAILDESVLKWLK